MAEFRQFTFSDNGTEITFMENFIATILSLDDSFSLENESGESITVASEFEDRTSSKIATFYINLGNGTRLRFLRDKSNNASGKAYLASFSGNSYSLSAQVIFDTTSWGLGIDTVITRPVFIGYLKSDTMLILWLGGYGVQTISSSTCVSSKITDGSNIYTGFINSANPMSANFIYNNTSFTYASSLPYAQSPGNIDFINSTSFVSGGVKQFSCTDILSCSTVPQWSSIALPNGKNYLAIGTHALVEVEPST